MSDRAYRESKLIQHQVNVRLDLKVLKQLEKINFYGFIFRAVFNNQLFTLKRQ
jgi:hypothetical protein